MSCLLYTFSWHRILILGVNICILLSHVVTRYLALPEDDTYTARLYDPITIPFVLGTDPLVNISRGNVTFALYNSELNLPVSTEPKYMKLSPYKGVLRYDLALLSLVGPYSLRVVIAGDVIASVNFNIIVNCKLININNRFTTVVN